MNYKKLDIFIIISIIYIFISFVLGFILTNGLVMFLGINIFLATIAYLLSKLFLNLLNKKVKDIYLLICFILYILFFPNTFYVITDFIHFQNYNFFFNYSSVYSYYFYDWIVFSHIVIGAILATNLGLRSILIMEKPIKALLKKYYIIYLSLIFILSSTGIYIGRFIRLNSWNFYRIDLMFSNILSHLSFFIGFILLFTFIQLVIYFVFTYNNKSIYNKIE